MTKVTRWVFLFRFFFQLKSNKVPHHFAWSRARLVLFQWRALGPRLDNAGVNADFPPRTNRHGKEAEETIISVCVQELNGLICGNTSSFTLIVKDCSQREEKQLFKTVFGTCSPFTRVLTVIINNRQSPEFQAWWSLLQTPQRKASFLRLAVQNWPKGHLVRKRHGSRRESLLNCLIELQRLGEGPSLHLSGLNLQAVSGGGT